MEIDQGKFLVIYMESTEEIARLSHGKVVFPHHHQA